MSSSATRIVRPVFPVFIKGSPARRANLSLAGLPAEASRCVLRWRSGSLGLAHFSRVRKYEDESGALSMGLGENHAVMGVDDLAADSKAKPGPRPLVSG